MSFQIIARPAAVCTALALAACEPSGAVQGYASENTVSYRYTAWDIVPTLTAEARDKAVKHCAQFGKHANYKGGNAVSPVSAEEIHTFACEDVKTDDAAVIAAQSKRPETVVVPVPSYTPTTTYCTDYGYSTTCTSY